MKIPWFKRKKKSRIIYLSLARIDTKFQTAETYYIDLELVKNNPPILSVKKIEGAPHAITLMVAEVPPGL